MNDFAVLSRDLYRIRTQKDAKARKDLIQKSAALYALRAKGVPNAPLNMALPVSQVADDIVRAIKNHQVIIVAAETGSGKTTQLPKLALMAGRGVSGQIVHTQPRRLAARMVSARIAEELGEPLGRSVGFKVRFSDESSKDGYIKVVTDGVLLSELNRDRFLSEYDTIIIDEAHERSVNIDFLLGYIKTLLKKRADLKLIITSATLDTQRFSQFFDGAPVIVAQGQSYPVEVRYRPIYESTKLDDALEDELPRALMSAIDECFAHARTHQRGGDILVFCATEAQIMTLKDAIKGIDADILTLFGRQSLSEQQRVFGTATKRRVILATNVAETSLTVPNIYYVIDLGFARTSRYDHRARILRLPIEPISQAAANQRRGRCGRIGDGVCIRLYSQSDFLSRPEFSEPEILRTSLAQVILQMTLLRLGRMEDFEFITAPDGRLVSDGYKLLEELGAIAQAPKPKNPAKSKNPAKVLTPIGKQMARLPIDPRLSRMLIGAKTYDCLDDALIVVSALAVQDVRERPFDKRTQADQKHALFYDNGSDFLFYVNLWRAFIDLPSNQKKQFAKTHFLSFLRLNEWQKTHAQLAKMAKDLDAVSVSVPPQLKPILRHFKPEDVPYAALHRALLTGLLSFVAKKDDNRQYLLAKNQKGYLFGASRLKKSLPNWIMGAELVQTSQIFLKTCAKILPTWILVEGAPLLKYHYFDPYFSKKTGRVHAYAQVSLYGLVIVAKAAVGFEEIDPVAARKIFIMDALVADNLNIDLPFLRQNRARLTQAYTLEDKARRRDLVVSDADLYEFYDARLPAHICSQKALMAHTASGDGHLFWSDDDILRTREFDHYPSHIKVNGLVLPVAYVFDPSDDHDGANVKIPKDALGQIGMDDLWLNLPRLDDVVLELIKTLPKDTRRKLVPLSDNLPDMGIIKTCGVMAGMVRAYRHLNVSADDFNAMALPKHLLPQIWVLDDKGRVLDKGRDLAQLKARHLGHAPIKVQASFDEHFVFEQSQKVGAARVPVYHALQMDGSIGRFMDKDLALWAHRWGLCALILPTLKAKIAPSKAAQLAFAAYGDVGKLKDIIAYAALFVSFERVATTYADYLADIDGIKTRFFANLPKITPLIERIYLDAQTVRARVLALDGAYDDVINDITDELHDLHLPDFIDKPISWHEYAGTWAWQEYPRFLAAILIRLDKLHKLDDELDKIDALDVHMERIANTEPKTAEQMRAFFEYRWLIQEWRISLFAQPMKTKIPTSAKRADTLWQKYCQSLQI